MSAIRMAALAVIVAGVLGLAYGSFSYTKETHETKIGPFELSTFPYGPVSAQSSSAASCS